MSSREINEDTEAQMNQRCRVLSSALFALRIQMNRDVPRERTNTVMIPKKPIEENSNIIKNRVITFSFDDSIPDSNEQDAVKITVTQSPVKMVLLLFNIYIWALKMAAA
jgi:hypothetical protein